MSPRSGEAGTRNEPPQHAESTQASTKDVVDGHRGHQRDKRSTSALCMAQMGPVQLSFLPPLPPAAFPHQWGKQS